ncbi:hypothetical protein GQ53DRAFT_819506 [Thozetella sp. PMI_491]|nr:hypothetical protein GQ53DRAFT_819506 [Thozetella sp. PMI_491]
MQDILATSHHISKGNKKAIRHSHQGFNPINNPPDPPQEEEAPTAEQENDIPCITYVGRIGCNETVRCVLDPNSRKDRYTKCLASNYNYPKVPATAEGAVRTFIEVVSTRHAGKVEDKAYKKAYKLARKAIKNTKEVPAKEELDERTLLRAILGEVHALRADLTAARA